MLNAAAHVNTGWAYHTITMFRIAISPVPPPTGRMTWHSMLPMATRNLRRIDEAIRQAELSRNLTPPLYPKQGQTIKHQHALYELGMAFNRCKLPQSSPISSHFVQRVEIQLAAPDIY